MAWLPLPPFLSFERRYHMPMYPRDRLLAFLAKIANEPGPDLEPRDWLEYYLDKIAENGGGGGDATDYVVFMHDYNTGEVKYESTIDLKDLDASKKVNFYIADTDFTEPAFWGLAVPCCSVSYGAGYGNVSAIMIQAESTSFSAMTFTWEITNNQPVLTFSDSRYTLTGA
jgi:hypothetical protein